MMAIDPRDIPFMEAAAESERLLRQIDRGWEPSCDKMALREARRAAMHDMIADLPDAREAAMRMPSVFVDALVHAERGLDREFCGAWCVVDNAPLDVMRSMGLVHLRYRTLTAFGRSVRAELLKDEA